MSDIPTPVIRARELRQNMTKTETLLWNELRNRKFLKLKFLRQHPLIYQIDAARPYYFVADFYCAQKRLVIEDDGKIHDFQKEEDQHREDILKSLDLKIIRIKNEETKDMKKTLERIKEFIMRLE